MEQIPHLDLIRALESIPLWNRFPAFGSFGYGSDSDSDFGSRKKGIITRVPLTRELSTLWTKMGKGSECAACTLFLGPVCGHCPHWKQVPGFMGLHAARPFPSLLMNLRWRSPQYHRPYFGSKGHWVAWPRNLWGFDIKLSLRCGNQVCLGSK